MGLGAQQMDWYHQASPPFCLGECNKLAYTGNWYVLSNHIESVFLVKIKSWIFYSSVLCMLVSEWIRHRPYPVPHLPPPMCDYSLGDLSIG